MSLIHSQVTSLHNGVSEQQAELRLDSQSESMTNCMATVNVGLRRRNPTQNIKNHVSQSGTDYSYSYDRGIQGSGEERYIISVNGSGITVIDALTGNKKTVNYNGDSLQYLMPFEPYNGYSMITVKDTSFITNRNKIVAVEDIGTSIPYDKEAYVWIKYNEPVSGYTYTVVLDGNTVTATETTSTEAASSLGVSINALDDFTAVVKGSIVKITKGGNDFIFASGDSYGDQASVGWKGAVNTMNDLPKNMTGFTDVYVRIAGVESTQYSAYFVKYVTGTWVETRDPLNITKPNYSTMPHKLTRESDGTFTLQSMEYDSIEAGDYSTNETPYFVTNTIKDIFFFANRLCFLSDNALNMSQTGRYTNFYRTTVLSMLDTDPINVNIDAKQALKMSYAVENDSVLMLFSDKAQFVINTIGVISPTNIEVKQSTAYAYNPLVRPEACNGSLFFASIRNNKTAMYEYIAKSFSESQRIGTDITNHVQKYIDSGIVQMASLPVHNLVFLRSKEEKDTLYVYKYMYDGESRVQANWSKWKFNGVINTIQGFSDSLYMLIDREDKLLAEDWILAGGIWHDDKNWSDTAVWQDSSVPAIPTLEKLDMTPIAIDNEFLDNGDTVFNSEVALTEWIAKNNKVRDIRGHLQFKTVQVSSEAGSEFTLQITNLVNGKSRVVPSVYTVSRKPMVMGKAEDMRLKLSSVDKYGFQINTISYEGNRVSRSRLAK